MASGSPRNRLILTPRRKFFVRKLRHIRPKAGARLHDGDNAGQRGRFGFVAHPGTEREAAQGHGRGRQPCFGKLIVAQSVQPSGRSHRKRVEKCWQVRVMTARSRHLLHAGISRKCARSAPGRSPRPEGCQGRPQDNQDPGRRSARPAARWSSPAAMKKGAATCTRSTRRAKCLARAGAGVADMSHPFRSAGIIRASVPSLRTNWLKRAARPWARAAKNSAVESAKCTPPKGAISFQVSMPVTTIAARRP